MTSFVALAIGMVTLLGVARSIAAGGTTNGGSTAAEGADISSIEDEFRTSDPVFSASPSKAEPEAVWSDGKVSLAGLLSFQWARQELDLLGPFEYLALGVMVLYLTVYIWGRRQNSKIANSFIKEVHGLFCSRFL